MEPMFNVNMWNNHDNNTDTVFDTKYWIVLDKNDVIGL